MTRIYSLTLHAESNTKEEEKILGYYTSKKTAESLAKLLKNAYKKSDIYRDYECFFIIKSHVLNELTTEGSLFLESLHYGE